MPFQKGNIPKHKGGQSEDCAVMKLFNGAYEKENGCIITTRYLNEKGYPRMRVRTKKRYMSHVIYERYIGAVPEGMCMLHKCDTPACINPQHLFIGTKADNNYDMVAKGRNSISGVGENHHSTTLTDAEALEIKKAYKFRVVTAVMLAEKYKTTKNVVMDIVHERTWRHV